MKAWSAFKTVYDNSGENPLGVLYISMALNYPIEEPWALASLVEDLEDPLLDNLLFFNNSKINRMDTIINADTGEVYKPSSKRSKLRKR